MSNLSTTVWLLDVTVLGRKAFDHVDLNGRSLRAILEAADIKKVIKLPQILRFLLMQRHTWQVFYDVRNDADALFPSMVWI